MSLTNNLFKLITAPGIYVTQNKITASIKYFLGMLTIRNFSSMGMWQFMDEISAIITTVFNFRQSELF